MVAEPDEALLHLLRMGRPLDIKHLKQFLETFSDYTALVCTTSALSQRVVEVCDLLEIGIPADLSIASLQRAGTRPESESGGSLPVFIIGGRSCLPPVLPRSMPVADTRTSPAWIFTRRCCGMKARPG